MRRIYFLNDEFFVTSYTESLHFGVNLTQTEDEIGGYMCWLLLKYDFYQGSKRKYILVCSLDDDNDDGMVEWK